MRKIIFAFAASACALALAAVPATASAPAPLAVHTAPTAYNPVLCQLFGIDCKPPKNKPTAP